MRREYEDAAAAGAGLVELRVDFLSRLPDFGALLAERPASVVITCRRQEDHGRWRGTEEERQTVLKSAILSGADYVDLEVDVAQSIRRYKETKRIVSYHDFESTPDDLEKLHKQMRECDPDIIKLVTMANSPDDNIRMLQLVSEAEVPTVGFCMGEFGTLSRILCGRFGSPMTYAAFTSDRELAPGQLSLKEMQQVYHYDAIGPETDIYAVIGDPIGHSLSPLLHNTALHDAGADAVYVPIRIARGNVPSMLEALDHLPIRGYSVTIPHKLAALEVSDTADPLAERIGAANTLVPRDGGWHAMNTDCDAAVETIRQGFRDGDQADSLDGRRVLILGSGGVSRAIAAGLLEAGANVTVCGRSPDKARTLAEELGCKVAPWDQRATGSYDVLVNGTPVGMHPNVNETPFPGTWLVPGMLVFDTIYNPERTLLIKEAKEQGCLTASGLDMFVRQAATQYRAFTNIEPPIELMRETLRKHFNPANY